MRNLKISVIRICNPKYRQNVPLKVKVYSSRKILNTSKNNVKSINMLKEGKTYLRKKIIKKLDFPKRSKRNKMLFNKEGII